MQRLHEEDMSGFVLNGGMGEEFHHLKLAAIQPDGTALWPAKHTLEELQRERSADPFTFSGQMQQEPSPEDGTFFKKEWFQRYRVGSEPERLVKYGAGDFAVSEGEGDYTEIAVGGFDIKEDFYLLDWWSGQTDAARWADELCRLDKAHQPELWVAESGVIKRATEPLVKQAMKKHGYFRTEWLPTTGNKAAMARSFQGLASQRKVFIPLTPWGDELIQQLLQFPAGKYDDKVDVCGLFGRILHQTYAPSAIVKEEQRMKDSYNLDEEQDEDWKTL
jgi:predicted phage terminase large subunit-like protein